MGIRFDPNPPKGDPNAAIAAFAKSIGKGIQGDFLGAGKR